MSLIGITGAVMVMVAHGLLAALSFGLSGTLYKETQDLTLSRYGGILKQTPFLGSAFLMAMMAACGLPGFANFVGEALVFFGAWSSYPWQTVIACWGGLVIGGVYMLRAIRSLLHGESGEATLSIKDAHGVGERTPYALLLASLLVFGFVPGILVNKIKPEVELILSRFNEDGPVTRLAVETTSNVKHLSGVAEKGTLQAQ